MKLFFFILGMMTSGAGAGQSGSVKATPAIEPLVVKKCLDFNITGNGSKPEWNKTDWLPLTKLDTGGKNYKTSFKILYSSSGIYLLFEGEDNKITTHFDKDFDELYKGDVFEAFFHPDISTPLYFEYEINQFGKELVLLISNKKGKFFSWVPWRYEKQRQIKTKVNIKEGKIETGATIKSWSAEIFFSYSVLNTLNNVPPVSGTVWHANFYRLDYDSGNMIKWAWAFVDHSFHEFEKFRPIKFE